MILNSDKPLDKPNFQLIKCCINCKFMRQGNANRLYCNSDLSFETINPNSAIHIMQWCRNHETASLAVCDNFKSLMENGNEITKQ